jgi:CheY-like chemotaxis protein
MGSRILLVDGDDDIREVASAILENWGFDVVTAAGPFAALALLEADGIDALLTDIRMPGMNGFELADA